MNRLTLIAAAAAALLAPGLAAGAAQAHDAYGYAGYDGGYADEGPDCGRDRFTILGGHAGATVLGFNAGVGGHFGFGDGCRRHHRRAGSGEEGYAPPQQRQPPVDPYPAAYPQAPWGAPYAYRTYGPPEYAQGPEQEGSEQEGPQQEGPGSEGPGAEGPGYGEPPGYGRDDAPPPPPYENPCDVCAPEPGWR